jgi:hypothetical protein
LDCSWANAPGMRITGTRRKQRPRVFMADPL